MQYQKPVKAIKQKKCKVCKKPFIPNRPLETWCSYDCAIILANRALEKKQASKIRAERKERRDAKIKAKTRGDWMREAQAAFNAFIRARDEMAGYACISCSATNRDSWDAGHYVARSVSPSLRFNEENAHRQCIPCNQHKHGNLIEYRKGLIIRIGLDRVEWLEGQHPPAKYSIEDLKEIIGIYKRKTKDLKNGKA